MLNERAVRSLCLGLTLVASLAFAQQDISDRSVWVLFLIRPPPRKHIEGGLAVGFKHSFFLNTSRDGVEIGLPHEYVLWRDDLGRRQFGIELRPGVFLTPQGVDPSVELALKIP